MVARGPDFPSSELRNVRFSLTKTFTIEDGSTLQAKNCAVKGDNKCPY